jgi:hypothetical protein
LTDRLNIPVPPELLRLCAEMHRCADHVTALDTHARETGEETPADIITAADNALAAAAQAAMEPLPQTPAGLVAKARATHTVLRHYVEEFAGIAEEGSAEWHEWFALTLAEDVLRLAGESFPDLPPPWVPPSREEREAQRASRQATAWEIAARAERERLAALGLSRRAGLTVSDYQLVAWLLRRISAEMGEDAAARVLALSTCKPESFGAGYRYEFDELA